MDTASDSLPGEAGASTELASEEKLRVVVVVVVVVVLASCMPLPPSLAWV